MNAEFNWWLLIVGLVGGAGLVWLILGDWSRREEEVGEGERARESAWIAESMREDGAVIDPVTAEEVLRRHRVWLRETGDYDPLDDEWALAAEATADPTPESQPTPEARLTPEPSPRLEAAAAELRMEPSVRTPEHALRGDPPAGG